MFLNEDTAATATGYEIVSSSVNDALDAWVLRLLAQGGTRMIVQRSTGYNNIDVDEARRLGIGVARCRITPPTPWPSSPGPWPSR